MAGKTVSCDPAVVQATKLTQWMDDKWTPAKVSVCLSDPKCMLAVCWLFAGCLLAVYADCLLAYTYCSIGSTLESSSLDLSLIV